METTALHQKYNVFKVVDYIILFHHENGKKINNLRLNGILYFLQAYFLQQTGNVCFIEELEARDYGPVVPAVYSKFSKFGVEDIPNPKNTDDPGFTPSDRKLIHELLEFTGKMSNATISNTIHDQRPYRHARDSHGKVIRPEKLKSYFG
ncbi:MAG: DUF4065 domain-containing protein [Ruminococcus sp.]|nr:DUF4065 domain-containing protein [Ruminococcus sp.]